LFGATPGGSVDDPGIAIWRRFQNILWRGLLFHVEHTNAQVIVLRLAISTPCGDVLEPSGFGGGIALKGFTSGKVRCSTWNTSGPSGPSAGPSSTRCPLLAGGLRPIPRCPCRGGGTPRRGDEGLDPLGGGVSLTESGRSSELLYGGQIIGCPMTSGASPARPGSRVECSETCVADVGNPEELLTS